MAGFQLPISIKVLLFVYQRFNGIAPKYISALLIMNELTKAKFPKVSKASQSDDLNWERKCLIHHAHSAITFFLGLDLFLFFFGKLYPELRL